MLGWLQAEAATPSFEEAEGTYFEMLAALRSVDISPHRIRLPSHTQEAVGWFLADLG